MENQMAKLIANNVTIDTPFAQKFVDVYELRDIASSEMMKALTTKNIEKSNHFAEMYEKLDEEVRVVGRLIFGEKFDKSENKHCPTSWRNLSSRNVMIV